MSASPNVDPAFTRRLYGRRQGHALRQGQATLVDELLPQVAVPEEGALTAEHLFGSARPMQFEIGFGGGEHMAAQAKAHPRHGFIGCEPFLNGIVASLWHIRDGGPSHVRHPLVPPSGWLDRP